MGALDDTIGGVVGALVGALAKATGESIIEDVVKPLLVEFGPDLVRSKIDYIGLALASADARADRKFKVQKDVETMIAMYGSNDVYTAFQNATLQTVILPSVLKDGDTVPESPQALRNRTDPENQG